MTFQKITVYICRETVPMRPTGPVVSSRVTWTEPLGGALKVYAAETSLDGGRTWRRVDNGQPVPGLYPGDWPEAVRARLLVEAPEGGGSWPMPDFNVKIACDTGLNTKKAPAPNP